MIDDKIAAASAVVNEPHPLAPLEAHLNGSVHNAGGAIKAIEAWFQKEVAKLRAEFSKGDKESE
jgi:hypothetical protein